MIDKKKQGKRNRAQGKAFEIRVRKDLEEKGWICSKWANNVSDFPEDNIKKIWEEREDRKLIPAKSQYNPFFKRIVGEGSGFPDYVCYKNKGLIYEMLFEVIGVESKVNGLLDKQECAKCKWLLKNNIFSRILIAQKIKVKNKIVVEYKEFKDGKM